jgi:tetratricopeptide (TPR) repeat protein
MLTAASALGANRKICRLRFLLLPFLICLIFVFISGCGNAEKKKVKYYQKGLILSQRGRYTEAVGELQKALAIDPAMAEAQLELGRCYRNLHYYDQALQALETARRTSSQLALPALYQIAHVYVETEQLEAAEEIAVQTLKTHPDDADFMLFLGKLKWQQEKPDEAVEWLKKAAQANPKQTEPLLVLAEISMRKGEYSSAEENLKKVIGIDPNNNPAKLALAKIYRFTGKTDEAIETLRHVLEKEPGNVIALGALVETYYNADRLDDARREAETLLSASPGSLHANSLLGAILLKQKKYEEAVVYLTKAAGPPSASAKDNYLLGIALKETGQPAQAISAFQKALTLEPNNSAARLVLAETFLSEGSFENARNEVKQVLSEEPDNDIARKLWTRANALQQAFDHIEATLTAQGMSDETTKIVTAALNSFRSGDLRTAEDICGDLLKDQNTSPIALNLLGMIYLKQNQLEKALAQFERASRVNPKFAPSHINMANVYMAIGSYSAAASSFKEAMELSSKDPVVRLRYARTLTLLKQDEKAEAFLKDIIQKEPDKIAYRRALADVLIEQHKYQEARRELMDLLKLDTKNIDAAVLLADCFAKDGDLRKAAKGYESLVHAAPQSKYLSERLALLNVALGMPEQAREVLSSQKDSKVNSSAGLVRALLMQDERRYNEAERILKELQKVAFGETPYELMIVNLRAARKQEKALPEIIQSSYYSEKFKESYTSMLRKGNLSPEQLDELNLALALVRVQWVAPALEKLQRIAAEVKPSGAILEMIGGLWEEQGQPARAKESYQAAVAAEPDYWPAYYRLGLLASLEDKDEDAINLFQTALQYKSDSLTTLLALALAYEATGKDAEALRTYQKVNQLEPNLAPVMNNLAWLLAKKPDTLNQALKFAQASVDAQPLKAAGRDTLGWVYFQKADFPKALEQLDKAVLLDSYNPSMRYHRGMARFKLGQTEKALQDFQEAVTATASFPEKPLTEQMIRQLS